LTETADAQMYADPKAVAAASRSVDLLQVQYFLHLARTLSADVAARQLRITATSLTRQVGALESALNVELFYRHSKGIALTHAGVTALHEFSGFIEQYERAVADTTAPESLGQRPFRLGVPWWATIENASALERCIELTGDHNGVDLEILASSAAADAVRDGELDAALVALPIDQRELTCQLIDHVDSNALLPSGHELARRSSVSLRDLAQLPNFVMFARHLNPLQYALLRQLHEEAGFVPRRVIFVEDAASMVQQVAAGQAAATFNVIAPRHLRFDGVSVVPLNPRHALRTTIALVTSTRQAPTLPSSFVAALQHLLVSHRDTAQPSPKLAGE
jgi:DNA-binding transcriptional LysR family regulator